MVQQDQSNEFVNASVIGRWRNRSLKIWEKSEQWWAVELKFRLRAELRARVKRWASMRRPSRSTSGRHESEHQLRPAQASETSSAAWPMQHEAHESQRWTASGQGAGSVPYSSGLRCASGESVYSCPAAHRVPRGSCGQAGATFADRTQGALSGKNFRKLSPSALPSIWRSWPRPPSGRAGGRRRRRRCCSRRRRRHRHTRAAAENHEKFRSWAPTLTMYTYACAGTLPFALVLLVLHYWAAKDMAAAAAAKYAGLCLLPRSAVLRAVYSDSATI